MVITRASASVRSTFGWCGCTSSELMSQVSTRVLQVGGRSGTYPDPPGSVAPQGGVRMSTRVVAATLAALGALLLPATAGAVRDYTRKAYDVMPPGQSGSIPPDRHSTDQLKLYDGLTPLL